jgi:hypothetical protein
MKNFLSVFLNIFKESVDFIGIDGVILGIILSLLTIITILLIYRNEVSNVFDCPMTKRFIQKAITLFNRRNK